MQSAATITTLATENFSVAALIAAHNAAVGIISSFSASGTTPEKLAEQYVQLFRSTYNAIKNASS